MHRMDFAEGTGNGRERTVTRSEPDSTSRRSEDYEANAPPYQLSHSWWTWVVDALENYAYTLVNTIVSFSTVLYSRRCTSHRWLCAIRFARCGNRNERNVTRTRFELVTWNITKRTRCQLMSNKGRVCSVVHLFVVYFLTHHICNIWSEIVEL